MCVMYQDWNINCGEQIKNDYVLYVYILYKYVLP